MTVENKLIRLLSGRRGHFRMESGYHSELWFNLDLLFERPERLKPFIDELAKRLSAHNIEAVCGPMTGGARLAESVAAVLNVEYLFTERFERPGVTEMFPVRYVLPSVMREKVRNKTVAIVDDAVSAGSAARGTLTDLVACGARPVALGALFVFGDVAEIFAAKNGLALEGIAKMSFGMWKPAECPLCQAGLAVENVASADGVT